MIYYLIFGLFLVGLYCVLVKRDIFKMIYGISIMGFAVTLFLTSLGWVRDGNIPINPQYPSVDPLPQAMVITTIVIEFAVMVFLISLAIRLFEEYEDLDLDNLRRLRG